jgi:hypothetical protein
MRHRVGAIGTTAAVVVLLQIIFAGVASAHSLSLSAQAVCVGATPMINFTVTSWSTGADGINPKVTVSFNNVIVFTGAFVEATGNTFSGSVAAPSGTSVFVSAVAVGDWPSDSGGQTSSTTVTIPAECASGGGGSGNGRFTGGGKQVDVGDVASITRGLTIHCDLLLSNNLEINWGRGNNFHMLEHLETVACFDDPEIDQRPPKAPLDTLIGRGTGRYNGADGYSIEFTLVDAGEPGRSDEMGFVITAPDGSVVINVPLQHLAGGNLQAHFDQPHKR